MFDGEKRHETILFCLFFNKCEKEKSVLPFGVSGTPRGQMILRMQYSERMPYGPTSRRLMISVVVISVSDVSVAMSGDRAGLVW